MAQSWMTRFFGVENFAEAEARAVLQSGGSPMSRAETYDYSYFTGLPNSAQVIMDMNSARTRDQKIEIATTWINTNLRLMAGRVAPIYLLSRRVVQRCCVEIMRGDYLPYVQSLEGHYNDAATTLDQANAYREATATFRTNLQDLFNNDLFTDANTNPFGVIEVPRVVLGEVNSLYRELMEQRAQQLGGATARRVTRGMANAGAVRESHLEAFESYFLGLSDRPTGMDIFKMTSERTPGPRHYLISSAMAGLARRNGTTIEEVIQARAAELQNRPEWPAALNHANELYLAAEANNNAAAERQGQQGGGGNPGIEQQGVNIDIIFNTYLWFRISGVIILNPTATALSEDGWRNLAKMNALLHDIGRRIVGKERLREMLTNTGIVGTEPLRDHMNTTGSIYQPPFCINPGRVYDMVMVFGLMKVTRVDYSFFSVSISPRILVGLRFTSAAGMKFIVTYSHLMKALDQLIEGAARNPAIASNAEVLHMFHQLLINKRTAYVRSTGMAGSITSSTFRASELPLMSHQRTMQHIIASSGREVAIRSIGLNPANVRDILAQLNAREARDRLAAQQQQNRINPGLILPEIQIPNQVQADNQQVNNEEQPLNVNQPLNAGRGQGIPRRD